MIVGVKAIYTLNFYMILKWRPITKMLHILENDVSSVVSIKQYQYSSINICKVKYWNIYW